MPKTTHIEYRDHTIHLSPESKITITTDGIHDLLEILDRAHPGDVVFIDIDDTIQTISS